MSFSAAVGPLTVLNLEGAAVPMATLWRERTLVLVFIRHFG